MQILSHRTSALKRLKEECFEASRESKSCSDGTAHIKRLVLEEESVDFLDFWARLNASTDQQPSLHVDKPVELVEWSSIGM